MTPDEKAKLFYKLLGLCDSDQSQERHAALDKIVEQRAPMGWPKFVEVAQRLESKITPEEFEDLRRDRDGWQRAHDERVAEKSLLEQRNAMLVKQIATLRVSLAVAVNWRKLAFVALVAGLAVGGWRWWSGNAVPDVSAAASPALSSLDAAFLDLLKREAWGEGDSPPRLANVEGVQYWIVLRGSLDPDSHVNAAGHALERRCLRLFASEAVPDAGAYLTPAPYFVWWMKWPQRAAECRLAGREQQERRNA